MALVMFLNKVISYWPSYRSKICCIGPRPKSNTADQGLGTGPIRNYMIDDYLLINLQKKT